MFSLTNFLAIVAFVLAIASNAQSVSVSTTTVFVTTDTCATSTSLALPAAESSFSSAVPPVPTSSSTTPPKPSVFLTTVDIPQGIRLQMMGGKGPKVKELMEGPGLSGPAKVNLNGSSYYNWNLYFAARGSTWLERIFSPGAKLDCAPVVPDPAKPYLTIYPRGVSLEFTTALFGGKSFGSEEPAIIDGLILNKYDNVEFVVKTDTHSYKCTVGTRGLKSQSKDVTFEITPQAASAGGDVIPKTFEAKENVGIECSRV